MDKKVLTVWNGSRRQTYSLLYNLMKERSLHYSIVFKCSILRSSTEVIEKSENFE